MNVVQNEPIITFESLLNKCSKQLIEKDGKTLISYVLATRFLSGMKKDDTLRPCMPTVFYYGKDEWDGQIDIHGLLGLNEHNPGVKKYIPNHQINFVDATGYNSH